ncbi:MAG: hypothetical protein QOD41_4227 [Cryptosporangiaceae bacterium]|nr:hypothetical protein [Cryptosporangiaceae bacterium]
MNLTSKHVWRIAAGASAVALVSAGAVGAAAAGDRPAAPARPGKAAAVAAARQSIAEHRQGLRAAPAEAFTPRSVVVDRDGSRHVRFDRTFRGLPVLGGDTVVHAAPDGRFRGATLTQSRPIGVGIRPVLAASKAKATGARRFAGTPKNVTADLVVDATSAVPALAWRVVAEGRTSAGQPSHLNVIVDARTGAVRQSYDDIHTAEGTGHGVHSGTVPLDTTQLPDGSYELRDPVRGTETRDARHEDAPYLTTSAPFTDADNDWGTGSRTDRVSMAADVHYGVRQAYDYFERTFGRRGAYDDGKGPLSYVDYGFYEHNAYYDDRCRCLAFGFGYPEEKPFSALDVVGHEFTHGVTAATAGLVYRGESGGLNEASSDIFGTLVEFTAGNASDTPDYLINEKGADKPLRYMDEPSKDGSSLSCWRPGIGTDGTDPHDASGIGNKFFYQLAVGSGKSSWGDSPTCNDAPTVTGIGNAKAGAIWYRALTLYMVGNTTYSGARQATLTAAADLYGAGGSEHQAVDAAWKAVNVDGSDPVPTGQEPVITPILGQLDVVNTPARLQIRAVDPQGGPVTFAADGLPAGLSISSTGLVTGTATERGFSRVTVTATDPDGHSAATSFGWSITSGRGEGVDIWAKAAVSSGNDWIDPGDHFTATVTTGSWIPTRTRLTIDYTERGQLTGFTAPGWQVVSQRPGQLVLRVGGAMINDPAPVVLSMVALEGPIGGAVITGTAALDDGLGTDPRPNDNVGWSMALINSYKDATGRVWEDTNGDGLRQPGEPARQGVKVTLWEAQHGTFENKGTVTTDAAGAFVFPHRLSGIWVKLQVAAPDSSWRFSPPDVGSDDTADSDYYPDKGDPLHATTKYYDLSSPGVPPDAGLVHQSGGGQPPPSTPPSTPPSSGPTAGASVPPSAVPSPPGPSATPGGGGSLPVTGQSLTEVLGAGLLLAVVGFVLVRIARRRIR